MVWWGIYTLLCYKFPTESNNERILKIGSYLAKLWARVWCLVFLTHGVDLQTCSYCNFSAEPVSASIWISYVMRMSGGGIARAILLQFSSLRRLSERTLPLKYTCFSSFQFSSCAAFLFGRTLLVAVMSIIKSPPDTCRYCEWYTIMTLNWSYNAAYAYYILAWLWVAR